MIPSQTDEQASLIRRLQGLDLARGPLEIEPLAGGMADPQMVERTAMPAVMDV